MQLIIGESDFGDEYEVSLDKVRSLACAALGMHIQAEKDNSSNVKTVGASKPSTRISQLTNQLFYSFLSTSSPPRLYHSPW